MTVAQQEQAGPTAFAPEEPGSDRWVLNFGPQHPATRTTLRLVLELDGEWVFACTPHIGDLDSGFEKLGEHQNLYQYVVVNDRMNRILGIGTLRLRSGIRQTMNRS